jgi:DNA-binding NtrC family response regulator
MLATARDRILAAGDRRSQVIQGVIKETSLNRLEVAAIIGISSATLYREIAKAGIVLKRGCRPVLFKKRAKL